MSEFPDDTFEDKLRQVFVRLFNDPKHRVQDDTLLEKLRDLLRNALSSVKAKNHTDFLNVLNDETWILSLTRNHERIDPHVTAFGLLVIGDMAIIDATCRQQLVINGDNLKIFFRDVPRRIPLHASVRCAYLTSLRNIWACDVIFSQNFVSISRALRYGLMDSSIFVVKEAKQFATDYMVTALKNQSTMDDSEFLDWLVGSVRKMESERNALMALDVLESIVRKDSTIVTNLCRLTKLKTVLMDRLVNSEDDGVCNACCCLLISLNCWSFDPEPLTEWMTVLDMLLCKQSLTIAAMFIVVTCEKFSSDNRVSIPSSLINLLIEPITICFQWKTNANASNISSSKWWIPIKENLSNQSGTIKLCSYILANLPKFYASLSNQDKLDFVKMLLDVLMETCNLLTLSSKIQTSVMTALTLLLKESWCSNDSGELCLTDEDRLDIWSHVINAAEQPASSALISTKRMSLLRILLRGSDKEVKPIWNKLETRLSQLLQKRCHDVHWEVRDSSVETFGEIIKKSKDCSFLSDWCVTCGLINVLVASMDDVEGYVRASILQVMSVISTASSLIQQEVSRLLPIERLILIVLTDDESVVRRAAAKALMSWSFFSKLRNLLVTHIKETFIIASADLDWEVKLIAVDFWKKSLTDSINQFEHDDSKLLESLLRTGFCDAMIQLATDQDITVRHEMAMLIKNFKQIPIIEKQLGEIDMLGNDDNVIVIAPEEILKLKPMSDETKFAAIDKVLDTLDSKLVNDVMIQRTCQPEFSTIASETNNNNIKLEHLISSHHRFRRQRITALIFLKWLRNLDLDSLLEQSDLTTDIYENNPEALLDDLLMAHEESETEEEIALDCY